MKSYKFENQTTYTFSDEMSLMFKDVRTGFEAYIVMAGAGKTKIGQYYAGTWSWENEAERKIFFQVLDSHGTEFTKAFKAYQRPKPEPSFALTVQCARRRLEIKLKKQKRKFTDKLVEIFYEGNRI